MANEGEKEQKPINIPQNKFLWIFGGLIFFVVAWFGYKALLSSVEDYKVTLVDAPKQADTGTIATFTWRVDGPPTTINHTSVHMGLESNPGEFGKDVKPADTKYTDMVTDFANGSYNVPLQFVGNIKMAKEGKYYFRVHAAVKDKNYWSDEFSFDVVKATAIGEYKITLLYPPKAVSLAVLPKEATGGGTVTFTWKIEGLPTTINHTSVHYGFISNPGKLSAEVKPTDTKYTDMVSDFANGKYDIPLAFTGNTKIASAGAYFFRAHALINGKNYWTDEYTLTAK